MKTSPTPKYIDFKSICGNPVLGNDLMRCLALSDDDRTAFLKRISDDILSQKKTIEHISRHAEFLHLPRLSKALAPILENVKLQIAECMKIKERKLAIYN